MNTTIIDGREYRTCDADGTHHFSHVKKLALSGRQYIHAVNTESRPSSAMLLGTAVHALVLGARHGAKPLAVFDGKTRRGKAWDEFEAENEGAELLTSTEWERANVIARAVKSDPVAQQYLDGARFEVPLQWDEGGILCSTSGVDIVTAGGALGDLKTTSSAHPDTWMRQAFRMLYPQQLAWYRRGARANGIATPGGLFLLGVETCEPFEVVALELTERMIDFADRTVSLWLEKLRVYRESNQWPGYAQSPLAFDVPGWAQDDEDADDDSDEEEAA